MAPSVLYYADEILISGKLTGDIQSLLSTQMKKEEGCRLKLKACSSNKYKLLHTYLSRVLLYYE